jgi:hypothetical protein
MADKDEEGGEVELQVGGLKITAGLKDLNPRAKCGDQGFP